MDDSPIAALVRHADAVEAAHLQVVNAAHQLAAEAEANRPSKRPSSTHAANDQQG